LGLIPLLLYNGNRYLDYRRDDAILVMDVAFNASDLAGGAGDDVGRFDTRKNNYGSEFEC
jgi:hypothetical protein